MIQITAINAFSDNYIWCMYDDQSQQAVIVDPGDAAPVKAALDTLGLKLTAILITHHHFDHTGGIDDLLADAPVPVYGPHNQEIPQITHRLAENDTLQVLGLDFRAIEIPGHTLDHIALFCSDNPTAPILFSGDTLFAGGCGRVFEGNPAMMLDSLTKLAQLPSDTRVYCAHEYTLANLAFAAAVEPDNQPLQQRITHDSQLREKSMPTIPSTIGIELATNPFLRCAEAVVIDRAEQRSPLDSPQLNSDPAEVFSIIRAWKDDF